MDCMQDAPLRFTESDDNQTNRKRSRETAQRLHDTVSRGAVQSVHAEGRYFTNPASIDFFPPDFKAFLPENLCKSASFVKLLQFHLKNRLGNIQRNQISILTVGGRELTSEKCGLIKNETMSFIRWTEETYQRYLLDFDM